MRCDFVTFPILSMKPIEYQTEFSDLVSQVNSVVDTWFAGPRVSSPKLACFDVPVYLKNRDSVVTWANDAYQHFFARGVHPIGKSADSFLYHSIAEVARQSDRLLTTNAKTSDFLHSGLGPDGLNYEIRTYKRSLVHLGHDAFAVLGVSRPVAISETTQIDTSPVSIQFRVFSELDSNEKCICKRRPLVSHRAKLQVNWNARLGPLKSLERKSWHNLDSSSRSKK